MKQLDIVGLRAISVVHSDHAAPGAAHAGRLDQFESGRMICNTSA